VILNTCIFLFTYKEPNLDKNLVLGCGFFSDFSLPPEGFGKLGVDPVFGTAEKFGRSPVLTKASPKGDKNQIKYDSAVPVSGISWQFPRTPPAPKNLLPLGRFGPLTPS
jgi:hypothetical protein